MAEAAKVGKRGIPARIRRQFGIDEGTTVLVSAGPDGVMTRPAVTVPVEVYSLEREAAFVLEFWLKPENYPELRDQVRRLGVDPDQISHTRPKEVDRLLLDADVLFSAAYGASLH